MPKLLRQFLYHGEGLRRILPLCLLPKWADGKRPE